MDPLHGTEHGVAEMEDGMFHGRRRFHGSGSHCGNDYL